MNTLLMVPDSFQLTNGESGERPGETRVQSVITKTAELIRTRSLRVGDQLPSEGDFSRELGVSRTVVREAFGALAALGVLDVGNGRRPRVSAVRPESMAIALGHAVHTQQVSVLQVWEVRRSIERATAGLAARNRSAEQAETIIACAQGMVLAGAPSERMTYLDIKMHRTIAAASRNPIFEHILASIEPLMFDAVPAAWDTQRTPEQRHEIVHKHLALATAIVEQDPLAAEQAMDSHFDASIARLLAEGSSAGDPMRPSDQSR